MQQRSHRILSLWDSFLWITVSSFFNNSINYLWPDDDGLVIEAETCCHLVTLNKINIHNTSCVLTCESLHLTWSMCDDKKNVYMVMVGKRPLGRPRQRSENTARKQTLKKCDGKMLTQSYGTSWRQSAGQCECSHKPSGSIQRWSFVTNYRAVHFRRKTQHHGIS
jgi:hypothetical protein